MPTFKNVGTALHSVYRSNFTPRSIIATIDQALSWMNNVSTFINYQNGTGEMRLYGFPVLIFDHLTKNEIRKIFQEFDFIPVSKNDNYSINKFVCGTLFSKQDCFVLFD